MSRVCMYICRVPELEPGLRETIEIFAESRSAAQVFLVLVAGLASDEHVVYNVVKHAVPVLRWSGHGVGRAWVVPVSLS